MSVFTGIIVIVMGNSDLKQSTFAVARDDGDYIERIERGNALHVLGIVDVRQRRRSLYAELLAELSEIFVLCAVTR